MTVSTKKWLRRVGIGLLSLVVLAAASVWLGLQLSQRKMTRKLEIAVQAVAYRDDAAAVVRGQYLFNSRGCVDCHGANGGGRAFIDNADMRIAGPHISPGPGSVTAAYQPVDWVRSIRHGVNPAGHALLVMPSEDYARYTDDDLASLVAYIRSMPPAEGGAAVLVLPVAMRVLYGYGAIQDAAGKIDHTLPPPAPVADAVTREHGAYVANICIGCHGATLAGGKVPGGPPDWPPAARLTPGEGSVMPRYADARSFIQLFRTGKRADGTAVMVMPFDSFGKMSDTDLQALHLYLQSLKG